MFTLSHNKLTVLTLVYLLFPNILFLWGWFNPYIATFCTIAFIAVTVQLCRYNTERTSEVWNVTPQNFCIMFILFSFISLKVASCGLIGLFQTHIDLSIFREAFFQNLTKAPWPVILPDGREMSYYLAGDLVGAFFARVIPFEQKQHFITVIWSSFGFLLATLFFCVKNKRILWVLPLLLFCYCDFLNISMVLFCKHAEYYILTHILHISADSNASLIIPGIHHTHLPIINFFEPSCKYPTAIGRCEMYNSMPYSIAVAGCLATMGKKYCNLAPLLIVLLLSVSPLFAIGCIPMATYVFLKGFEWKNIKAYLNKFTHLIFPAFLSGIYAVYYLRGGSNITIGFSSINWGLLKTIIYFTNVIVVTFVLIYPMKKYIFHNTRLLICLICLCVYPLFYIGDLGVNHVNEFWLKTGFGFSFLLVGFFSLYWKKMNKHKYIPVCISVICIPIIIADVFLKIRHESFTIDDAWNGHIAYDCLIHRQKIPDCKKALIPYIILNKSGESEQHFPGCLLPKASGCDYSLPPKKQ